MIMKKTKVVSFCCGACLFFENLKLLSEEEVKNDRKYTVLEALITLRTDLVNVLKAKVIA